MGNDPIIGEYENRNSRGLRYMRGRRNGEVESRRKGNTVHEGERRATHKKKYLKCFFMLIIVLMSLFQD